jgi:hypothetical protein
LAVSFLSRSQQSKDMKFNLLFCGLLALAIPTAIPAEPPHDGNSSALKNAVILVIRHAEKPDDGYGLSAAGEARARAYVNYFENFKIDGQPLKLDCLFAAADSKESHRPRLTLEPTSKALGLAIDSRFKDKNFQGLADEIRSKPHGKAILIAWHQGKIPELLRALGADPRQVIPKGKWPEDVFNWLIQLHYDSDGHLIEAKRINENLPPNDSNKHTLAVLGPAGPSSPPG